MTDKDGRLCFTEHELENLKLQYILVGTLIGVVSTITIFSVLA